MELFGYPTAETVMGTGVTGFMAGSGVAHRARKPTHGISPALASPAFRNASVGNGLTLMRGVAPLADLAGAALASATVVPTFFARAIRNASAYALRRPLDAFVGLSVLIAS